MTLADTSVWIDYFNGAENQFTRKLHSLLAIELVAIGDIILTEILQGFRSEKDYILAKEVLDVLVCYPLVGKENAIKSAKNFRILKRKGVTIRKTIDTIIATFCIENNITLLHNDKDFDPFEKYLGLKVER